MDETMTEFPMTDWPTYESHKIVQAARIVWVGKSAGLETMISVEPIEGGPREYFVPTVAAMAERAEPGGYAVLYPDGFKSISPEAAFEQGYTRRP
jgi:hypothetical protein